MSGLQRQHLADIPELLSTKLAPPRLRTAVVPRPALLARLSAGLDHKLTLISAPAGFGKTTLVSQWITWNDERGTMNDEISLHRSSLIAHRSNVAWLSLDAGDNDLARFWRYVTTACQTFAPAIGTAAHALPHASQPPQPFEATLTAFINQLAGLACRGVLVLEDYHNISAYQIHETVAFLLDHLPPTLRLILISRNDPALPLARLRAHGELYELRAADLRLTLAETQAFLQRAIPFALSPETIAYLEARTEGWAVGLHLVALALQGRHDPREIERVLGSISGSHRHILEYLLTDVLAAQPELLQEFLLQTAFLSRLTPSLCDAVTGRTDGAAILDQLERSNLFLSPIDDARQWYRYHTLFAEAMRHVARQRLGEARLRAVFDSASRWYEQHGALAEAIEAALCAQAHTRVATLIEQIAGTQQLQHEVQTLRRWLEQLPPQVLEAYPALCLMYAVAILFTSDRCAPATARLLQAPLRAAEDNWRAAGNQHKLGEVLAFRSMVTFWQGDLARSAAAARQALALLPQDEMLWRGSCLLNVGVEEMLAGKPNVARQNILAARHRCEAAENVYAARAATLILGELCARQGELQQAAQLYRQVIAEAGEDISDQAHALIRYAALAYEWNDLAMAEQLVSQAIAIGRQLADADRMQFAAEEFLVPGSLILARILGARGEAAGARQLLSALVAQASRPALLREVQASLAWAALLDGDLAAVRRWAQVAAQPGDNLLRTQQECEALLVARMLIGQGEAGAALRLLGRWQPETQAHGRLRSELEILILMALAHAALHNQPQARQALLEALAQAQPQGYQRLFLDAGAPMAALLRTCLPDLRAEPLGSYARALRCAFAQEPTGHLVAALPAATHLLDPLSPQEQRVLRLLTAGLSNPEIAQELIVSVNTVKTQVQSIYRKLDVSSRREARSAARHLNLI
jgi:LuxR family maltose regulon positive regulatory protein